MQYCVCEISGRQYLIKPNQIIKVDKLTDSPTLLVDKVLLMVSDTGVEVGKPYLSKTLNFEVLGHIKLPKIRVAVYKSKSNYRKVRGHRQQMSQIRLVEDKKAAKAETDIKKEVKVKKTATKTKAKTE